ncbi:hypothetical protein ACWCO0_23045 [Streptomyces tubercidicus]
MKDITTTTGTTVPGSAIAQLLVTKDWLTGVRAAANSTVGERAAHAYESAYRLSGGGDLDHDAHRAASTNLLHEVAPAVVAFALHHLGAVLPDLTDEQWARLDAAAGALDLRVCEDLTGANGRAENDDTDGQGEEPRSAVAGIGAVADAEVPLPAAAAAACSALDAKEVLAAAQRFTWACTAPGNFLVPDASREVLGVALAAVWPEERGGYVRQLESFAERHRGRLEEMLRVYGPGSAPAQYGRFALVGQPESLVLCERLENASLLLQGLWDGELEDTLLDDLAFAWGARHRLGQ